MKRYTIQFSNIFEKEFAKLSAQNRKQVVETVEVMKNDPYYQSLRTKKMKGRRKRQRDWFESRVNRDIRLIWYFDEDDNKIILMVSVGHHDVEKQRKIQRH
jgi:mRNA-degrading endonuclease RelE of RelBE toxin-antitoxin system